MGHDSPVSHAVLTFFRDSKLYGRVPVQASDLMHKTRQCALTFYSSSDSFREGSLLDSFDHANRKSFIDE